MSQETIPLPQHSGDKLFWGNLTGAGTAYMIARTARSDCRPLLVITPDSASANRLQEELQFFLKHAGNIQIHQLPDWEILPYDAFSPHQDIISQRLSTLYQLPGASNNILIVPVTTLLLRLCPAQFLQGNCLSLKTGERFNVTDRRRELEQAGYRCVDTVLDHGEFAVRGAIMDFFPMGADTPCRIDLFDDEIDTLRTFDTETQRSLDQVDEIRLLPGHEFPLDQTAIEQFRARFRDAFDVDHRECPIYQDIGQAIASPGIEYYLPLFFEQTATLFDYLPESTRIISCEGIAEAAATLPAGCPGAFRKPPGRSSQATAATTPGYDAKRRAVSGHQPLSQGFP